MKYAILLTLTCAPGEETELWGEWRRTWNAVEKRYKRQVNFAWLELTELGRPHYHVLWVNPPYIEAETPAEYVERLWGHGHVDQQGWRGRGALRGAVAYVRGYVKKQGHKRYQQEYEAAPVGLRTFNTDRKRIPAEVLDAHLDRWESVYSGGVVLLTARLTHDPAEWCGPSPWECEQARRKARYRAGRKLGRVWANAEVSYRPNDHALKGGSARGPARPAGRPSSQLELLSEYAVWAWRVESLPW